MAAITEHEQGEIDSANASGKKPVVFVHGLWLLPSSWNRWREVFEEAGFSTLAPGWPDDPETVEEANADPGVFAHKSVGQVADHYEAVISKLADRPAVIGHSFGGLLAQILAGRGRSTATVAIDPAPFRGVLPLPISALRSAAPVLRNPANHHRAVPLTYEQFQYAFANAVDENEAKELYETYAVPGPGTPIFQAASANLNPWTEVKVKTKNPKRGPCSSWTGSATTPFRGRSPRRRTRSNDATRASPRSCGFLSAVTRSPSTTVGERWPTSRWRSSSGS